MVKFSPDGQLLGGWGEGVFAAPHGFHIDAEGKIWATDYNGSETVLTLAGGRRVKCDRNGRFLQRWGAPGDGPGAFDQPHALTLDSRWRVFVGDRYVFRFSCACSQNILRSLRGM